MTILFNSASVVKSDSFGRGLLRSLPTYKTTHNHSDEAWLIEDNARREAENRRIDRRYREAVAADRVANGWG